jgi:hypothetical protein
MDTNSLNPHYNTNQQNSVEYPIRSLKFILKKLKIRQLFYQFIHDPRSRIDDYDLTSLLMHGLATHLFRAPSKNKFRLYLMRLNASNAVAKFNGIEKHHSPCVRTLDDVLLNLNPNDFMPILPSIFSSLCRQKVFQLHPEFIPNGEYAITIDAHVTHTYHERSQHPCRNCPYCLKRTRGEKVWYVHLDLVASFVAPCGLQIPLLFHRIRARPEWGQLSENAWKQECERTAFPLLIKELRRYFPRLHLVIYLDALYATNPVLNLLEELRLGYSIVKKIKVLKTVGEDCGGLKALSLPLQAFIENERFKIHQLIYFFNDVAYRGHKLHIIQLDEEAEKKPSKRFAKILSKKSHWEWIVHQHLSSTNTYAVAAQSRIRWNQENLFNDIQCRGFAIRHDFNRAPGAQSIRVYLILIAYAITSILSYSTLGRSILSNGYTISFIMEQMLTDLIYISDEILFTWSDPSQLRFGKDPPKMKIYIES